MTPCCLADCAVLDVKLVVAHRLMVDSPCPDIAFHEPVAKWTFVTKSFLCDNRVLHSKSVSTDRAMVHLPCPNIAFHEPGARGTNVRIQFRNDAPILDLEIVTACAAMIYLACAYAAGDCLFARRADILEAFLFLRFSCLCVYHCLLARLGSFLFFSLHICPSFSGTVCSVFAPRVASSASALSLSLS